jgi:hypothetical protein
MRKRVKGMQQKLQTINIDPFVQNQLGALSYENVLLKAQLDYVKRVNQELQNKIKDLEEKLDSKETEPEKE